VDNLGDEILCFASCAVCCACAKCTLSGTFGATVTVVYVVTIMAFSANIVVSRTNYAIWIGAAWIQATIIFTFKNPELGWIIFALRTCMSTPATNKFTKITAIQVRFCDWSIALSKRSRWPVTARGITPR
jgi:hypothetical protein